MPEIVTRKRSKRGRSWVGMLLSPRFFYPFLVFFVILLRVPSSMYPAELNVDESQMLSQGMKFLVDPVPWRSVDGNSSGPGNSYIFTLLFLLGFEPGYVLAHWVATVLACIQILLTYATLLRIASRNIAGAIVVPLLAVYGFSYDQNLSAYSSELLPAALLSCGFYYFVKWLTAPKTLLLFASGVAIGATLMCKSQAVPIAGLTSIAIVVAIILHPSGRSLKVRMIHVVTYGTSAILPTAGVLCVVAQAGAIQEFWYSYILGNVAYAGAESWSATIGDAGVLFTDIRVQPFLALCLLGIVAFLASLWSRKHAMVSRRDWVLLGTLAVYAGAAVLAVCRPGTFFLHYISFLVYPASCLAGASLALAGESKRKAAFAMAMAVAILLVPLNVWLYAVHSTVLIRLQAHPPEDSNHQIAAIVREAQKRNNVDSLTIWGWAPGVHVLSGIPPATRDAVGYYQIGDNQFKGPLREHFRERFVSDLRQAKPDMFIDAVVPGTFRADSWTDNDGFESYSALKSFVADNYVLDRELELNPNEKKVRFFLRRP